jgi:hypothetical protein
MKMWRKSEIQQPNPFEYVLVKLENEEVAYIAYWDEDHYFEAHTNEVLHNVTIWMYIPVFPND